MKTRKKKRKLTKRQHEVLKILEKERSYLVSPAWSSGWVLIRSNSSDRLSRATGSAILSHLQRLTFEDGEQLPTGETAVNRRVIWVHPFRPEHAEKIMAARAENEARRDRIAQERAAWTRLVEKAELANSLIPALKACAYDTDKSQVLVNVDHLIELAQAVQL